MRIIAGSLKGRNLLPPPGSAPTRPMTGKVKESLFSILAGWMEPRSTVLDLYAGTGTMGIEALSRGAGLCCFAERDRQVVSRLRRNLDELGLEQRAEIWQGNIEIRLADWLEKLGQKVDLAFVDPPYAHARNWRWDRIDEVLFAPLARSLTTDGIIALRVPAEVDLPAKLGGLACVRENEYGDMSVGFYQHPDAPD